MSQATPIALESLRRLHPRSISEPKAIRALLRQLQRANVPLWRATNRFSQREMALVAAVDPQSLLLTTESFERSDQRPLFLNFEYRGRPYFFVAPMLGWRDDSLLLVERPAVVYQAERRDRPRQVAVPERGRTLRITLSSSEGELGAARVFDVSPGGLGIEVPGEAKTIAPGRRLRVRFLNGELEGENRFAEVRSRAPSSLRPGWTRLGLAVSEVSWGEPLRVERRRRILRVRRRVNTARPKRTATHSSLLTPTPRVVGYPNDKGESIHAIIDSWDDPKNGTAVVIPSAWGRTKETLLPLACTLLATFRNAGRPVVVVRFDGTGRRGESHRDPECLTPGTENLHFTFSQGARDIHATLDFLERSPEFKPRTTILVTFSVASIEGRRAMACDTAGRLGGWVSVVGAADAQSLTRVISGGVDYFGGIERGLRFGIQEIQGLLVDMDRAGEDALSEELAFLEDSRRDFGRIQAPITWIHGQFDGWMELDRIRHVMAFGNRSNRRIIQIPTGHQLRTSQEALEVFQLISVEVGRIALGRTPKTSAPELKELEARRRAETDRIGREQAHLRRFWRNYLIGREEGVGMELVTNTSAYRQLMDAQIEALNLAPGTRVLDAGSGLGAFPLQLSEIPVRASGILITECDYVIDALLDARRRLARPLPERPGTLGVCFMEADLDLDSDTRHVPFQARTYDAVLASLLLNYVRTPKTLLKEFHRVLRPGGRLVLSSLKRDADISTICIDTIAELQSGLGREALGADGERRMEKSLRNFINDAAKLLHLEDRGVFHFWDADELSSMLKRSGFRDVHIRTVFGNPPQALLATARRL